MARTINRVVRMSDDSEQNVKVVATYRLNQALSAIETFGKCFGKNYSWTEDQIAKADQAILDAAEKAITNIREGKVIAKAGVTL